MTQETDEKMLELLWEANRYLENIKDRLDAIIIRADLAKEEKKCSFFKRLFGI